MGNPTNVPQIPLIINKGETFEQTFGMYQGVLVNGVVTQGPALPLTGYTAHMQIRKSATDPVVIVDLSTAAGAISIDAPNGKISLTISAAVTLAIPNKGAVYYALETTDMNGRVKRQFEGPVYLTEDPVH